MMGWNGWMHGWGDAGWFGAGGWSWVWGIVMMIGMVLFWGLILWAVVTLVRRAATPPDAGGSSESHAVEIVREQFARGEIDRDEYQRRINVLRGARHDDGAATGSASS